MASLGDTRCASTPDVPPSACYRGRKSARLFAGAGAGDPAAVRPRHRGGLGVERRFGGKQRPLRAGHQQRGHVAVAEPLGPPRRRGSGTFTPRSVTRKRVPVPTPGAGRSRAIRPPPGGMTALSATRGSAPPVPPGCTSCGAGEMNHLDAVDAADPSRAAAPPSRRDPSHTTSCPSRYSFARPTPVTQAFLSSRVKHRSCWPADSAGRRYTATPAAGCAQRAAAVHGGADRGSAVQTGGPLTTT